MREDKVHPEPTTLLILTFLGGMASVFTALALQNFLYSQEIRTESFGIILYVASEELSKLFFAYIIALRSRADDEPVDPIIYMIAVALGFSALENTLFISSSIIQTGGTAGIITGILRYIGAMVLHVLSSASIGVAIGFAFYKEPAKRYISAVVGILIAIGLHAAFNLLIMKHGGDNLLLVFVPFWIAGLVLILCFEQVKKIFPSISRQSGPLLNNN